MCGFVLYKGNTPNRQEFKKLLKKIKYRGPDGTRIVQHNNTLVGFNRLAIMDLSENGMQPMENADIISVCNGEFYNYKNLKDNKYDYLSESDSEIILSLYKQNSNLYELGNLLDGEYAFALYDKNLDKVFAMRDPMGIRPLFYAKETNGIWFASELKAIPSHLEVTPFPPGHYYDGENFKSFNTVYETSELINSKSIAIDKINSLLTEAVKVRLNSDANIGFLLSGGLDSSLVCSIAAKESKTPIHTFAVGINKNPIDTKYAKTVSDYLGTIHTEVLFSEEDISNSLNNLIYRLETWDITTIRASVGMDLVCRYIRDNTDIKVIFTGEVSDELFGYKYTDFAPTGKEFQEDSIKRIKELYLYDVLRADRCIASNSLEARVPFSDTEFVNMVMSIDPSIKMNTYGIGKHLLREAFKDGYLPEDILLREKAAFSDAVGHRSVDYLKELADGIYTDDDFEERKKKFKVQPLSKEALMYKEIFLKHYPNKELIIPDYWMPNAEWDGCDVKDPSARALSNYGKSGN